MRRDSINFVVKVGMFSAIAFVLQLIGSILSIKVAGFLEVEISDLPAIILSLAMGPWAGVLVEFIKNLLHTAMTTTGFVGEFANFIINGTAVFVCGLIYRRNRSKKGAVLSLVVMILTLVIVGLLANIYIMLPLYMKDADITARINLAVSIIAPFNFCRGLTLSVITMLIYKKISRLIKK